MRGLVEIFKTRFPEFADPPEEQTPATDEQICICLGIADRYLSRRSWGKARCEAHLYLAAVYLSQMLRQAENGPASGEAGPVASASVGGVSVSYATSGKYGQGTSTDDFLLQYPPYGLAYMALRDTVMSGVTAGRT